MDVILSSDGEVLPTNEILKMKKSVEVDNSLEESYTFFSDIFSYYKTPRILPLIFS